MVVPVVQAVAETVQVVVAVVQVVPALAIHLAVLNVEAAANQIVRQVVLPPVKVIVTVIATHRAVPNVLGNVWH